MAVRLAAAPEEDDAAVLAAADTWARALERAAQCELAGAPSAGAEERLTSAISALHDAVCSRRTRVFQRATAMVDANRPSRSRPSG
jgi:hypothetical protein